MRARVILATGYLCALGGVFSALFSALLSVCFAYCIYRQLQNDPYSEWIYSVQALSVWVLGSLIVALSLGYCAYCLLFGKWFKISSHQTTTLPSKKIVLRNIFFATCAVFATLFIWGFWNGYAKHHFADGIVIPAGMTVEKTAQWPTPVWGIQSDDEYDLMANAPRSSDDGANNNIELPPLLVKTRCFFYAI